jgi:hypothetical protein
MVRWVSRISEVIVLYGQIYSTMYSETFKVRLDGLSRVTTVFNSGIRSKAVTRNI